MLSKKTKYGIKALSFLAAKGKGSKVIISDIAKAQNIPRKFLEAILLELKNGGFLGSKIGKGGGYYLKMAPEDISLAALYRILEGPIALLPCVSLNFYEKCADCPEEQACKLNQVMIEVRDSTLLVMENKSLADFL